MSETPLVAYALTKAIGTPAVLVLSVLYRVVSFESVKAYFAGEGPPPFAWCSREYVCTVLSSMSRSQVYEHFTTLLDAKVIRPSRQVARDGREHDGFELVLRDDGPVPGTRQGGGQQRRSESGNPDGQAASVREPGPPKSGFPESPVRKPRLTRPETRTDPSGNPDQNSSFNSELNSKINSVDAAEDDLDGSERPARATPPAAPTPVPASRPTARRPVTLIQGEPAGSGLTMARELLVEIGRMYSPTNAAGHVIKAQRICGSDPTALVLAERLLAVPLEGLSEDDARAALLDRFQHVVEMCRAFAERCKRDPSKVQFWRRGMLSLEAAPGKLSAWAMLEYNVAEDERAAGTAEVKAAEVKAAAAPAPATAAQQARAGKALAEVNALIGGAVKRLGGPASARASGLVDSDDEKQERSELWRGRRREARDEDDEARDRDRRYQLHTALVEARQLAGRELRPDEANAIRERFTAREGEGART